MQNIGLHILKSVMESLKTLPNQNFHNYFSFKNTANSDVEVIDMDQPSSSAGCSTAIASNVQQLPQPKKKLTTSSMPKFLDAMNADEGSKLNGLLSKAIYASNAPFNLVENDYWKDFFQALRPSYKVPSRYEVNILFLYADFYMPILR